MNVQMGDKIEFSSQQLIIFLSDFLEYVSEQVEETGELSAGGLAESRDYVVNEFKRREQDAEQ